MKWATLLEKVLFSPLALVGVALLLFGFASLLLVLDKIKAYEKLKNWFKPEFHHRRAGDSEGQTHPHRRRGESEYQDRKAVQRVDELIVIGRVTQLETTTKEIQEMLDRYVARKAEDDIVIGILKNEQKHFTEDLRNTDSNVDKLSTSVSQIKDRDNKKK